MSMKVVCSILLVAFLTTGCTLKSPYSDPLVSIQILDRNGFSETFSTPDRLHILEKTDFSTPQPYQKVVRVYGKSSKGKTSFKINTYHENGLPKQYLEVENGRARGKFFEWHDNGELKIDATLIEGTPDLSEMAQMTWVFDNICWVYDTEGNLIGEIPYDKGVLEGVSRYFYPNGQIWKELPYHRHQLHGIFNIFSPEGWWEEQISYVEGHKDGLAKGRWKIDELRYEEEYRKGLLWSGRYFDVKGNCVAKLEGGSGIQATFNHSKLNSLLEYRNGIPDGKVQIFDEQGHLSSSFEIKNGQKDGEEWHYYPFNGTERYKLYLQWKDGMIQGLVKTWYENGVLESQKEIYDNQKHGLSCAWTIDEELTLVEEYEQGKLMKGSYFKRGDKKAVSQIEAGKGIATLFDKEGRLLRKITYEEGEPKSNS